MVLKIINFFFSKGALYMSLSATHLEIFFPKIITVDHVKDIWVCVYHLQCPLY